MMRCLLTLLLLLGLGAADAADQGNPVASVAQPVTSPARGMAYSMDDKHKLRPGDVVSFRIVEDREEEAKKLQIADSGELDVPYIGRVLVAEKTCKELAAELKPALEKDYYFQATVIVGLESINKVVVVKEQKRVYVFGQVQTQGPVTIPEGEKFTAGKAILVAGGFASFADKKKVRVVRKARDGQSGTETSELDMVEILEKGKAEKDVVLQPEDMIYVPQRLVNF